MAFGFFREKAASVQSQQQQQQQPPWWQPPPTPQHVGQQYLFGAPQPTPQRGFSGEYYGGWNGGQGQQGLEPAPSGGVGGAWGRIEGRESPIKKLGWD